MALPTFANYVNLLWTLFDRFVQSQSARAQRGHPFVYQHQRLLVFFTLMHFRQIFHFKTQHRWLTQHLAYRQVLGLTTVPHRTTLSRRYKALYPILQDFVAFLAQYAEDLDPAFASRELYEDKSLFKAQGPVWHQSDRQAGRIPPGLHHLDTEATWSKSAYHGWVYGYGMHLSDNRAGFPKLVQIETASVSESPVLQAKEPRLVRALAPHTLTTDDAYTQARRIRRWAQAGVVLLTPALRWVKGRYATAYHRFIGAPQQAELLRSRRTAIEPIFDLLAQLIGATDNHKQLPLQGLANVRTCLALATLTLQVAMIANSIWGLPLRNISSMTTAFT
jgi:Transposase DDE domain